MRRLIRIVPEQPTSGLHFYTGKEVLRLTSTSHHLILGWYNPDTREWKEHILLDYPIIINGKKTPPIDIEFPALVPVFLKEGSTYIYHYSNKYETFAVQVLDDRLVAYHKRGNNLYKQMTVPLKAHLREHLGEAV